MSVNDDKDLKQDGAEEPAVGYSNFSKMSIKVYHSFEQEEQAQIEYWRGLTPEQRIAQLTEISKYAYSDFPKYEGNRLSFD